MTITYLDSKRLQGLSTDEPPASIVSDNFSSSTGWTLGSGFTISGGTFNISKTSGYLDGTRGTFDLGSNLSSTFVMRFKCNFSTLTLPDQSDYTLWIGVSNTTSANSTATDGYFVGVNLRNSSGIQEKKIVARVADDDTYNAGNYVSSYLNPIYVNTNYYCEIIKTGVNGNFTFNVYSDSTYTTNIHSTTATSAKNPTGLRYLWIGLEDYQAQRGSITWVGIVDDFIIYNGVTSVNGIKPTNVQTNSTFEQTDTNTRHWYNGTNWITQPTFEDDFSSYADQASADAVWVSNNTSKVRVNITNDNLDYTFNVGDTFLSISKDLTTVSNSAWVCRFKLRFSTLTTGNVNAPFMYCGLSSTVNSTEASTVNRIYMMLKYDSDDQKFGGLDTFGTNTYSTFENDGDNPQAFSPVISTDYFFEIVRTLDTAYTVKRYSDSSYSTVSQTSSGTCDAGVTSLRYFNISTHAGGTAGNITGTLDDFKFYNGVTSV